MKIIRSGIWCVSLVVCFGWLGIGAISAQRITNGSPEALKATIAKHPATCMFFFVEDCPVSMRDFSVVKQLRNTFSAENLAIIAVHVGQDSAGLARIADSIAMPIDFVADLGHRLVAMTDATITPEYFLFDKTGTLRYRGAIDNYAVDFGKHRRKATQHFLADAIRGILDGSPIPTTVTQPYGCYIERKD